MDSGINTGKSLTAVQHRRYPHLHNADLIQGVTWITLRRTADIGFNICWFAGIRKGVLAVENPGYEV